MASDFHCLHAHGFFPSHAAAFSAEGGIDMPLCDELNLLETLREVRSLVPPKELASDPTENEGHTHIYCHCTSE